MLVPSQLADNHAIIVKRTKAELELPADLAPLVAGLVEAARPLRVILFGSRARGEARPDSDADLLIVQAETDAVHRSRWRELQRIRAAVRGIPLAKDLVLYRPQEFDYWRHSLNHLVGRAVREGVLLYERT
jgi:predicted nucleotidyltransferase